MKEEVRRNNLELRGLRSFQDGNENRGQLFALTRVLQTLARPGCPSMSHRFPLAPFLSQRCELSHADKPRILRAVSLF